MAIFLLHTITFLAAFLLFQIELIIAKKLLPVYGGSYFVWGACLVFFQAFLLLGYVSVHCAVQKWGARVYRKIQLLLVFLPFLFFPGHVLGIGGGENSAFLAGSVFGRLLASIGPVFFVLSTISVALQSWLAASSLPQRSNPYALYATSNAGSLGALLTYPFIFELCLTLPQQEQFWRWGYGFLAVFNVLLFMLVPVNPPAPVSSTREKEMPGTKMGLWFLFSAAGVMLFMAVTNIITYAIAPVPLFWVLPLAIYLFAFVLSFKPKPWCPPWILKNISFLLAGGALLFFAVKKKSFPVAIELIVFSTALFLLCLYCQNRLAAHKPSSERHLTAFYLTLSFGGFLGGLLTSWVMPLVSKSVIEYLLALTLIAAAVWIAEKKTAGTRWLAHLRTGALAIVPALLCIFWIPEITGASSHAVFKARNYYGIYEVTDTKDVRILSHGTTLHGAQLRVPGLELVPSSFYSPTSPAGELFSSEKFRFQSCGIIGLGTGSLAIYTKPGDTMDYYELDPDIGVIAKKYFTFLANARGKISVFYGDARRSLELAPERKYDVLVVDAFGGDSIPFHLVTREAVAGYKEHLNEGGLLLFHISNRFIRLEPVLVEAARDAKAWVLYRMTSGQPAGLPSHWMAFTWDGTKFQTLVVDHGWEPIANRLTERHRVWTDGYSDILPFLNWGEIKRSLLSLKLFANEFER